MAVPPQPSAPDPAVEALHPSPSSATTAAAPASSVPAGVFDSALENLVRQFARPLDCLRELVQNSIDAGSPRVEVTLGWQDDAEKPGTGLLSISVRDFGEGMDEHVIDHELTQMFASSKAGDLSKIGRFGIGFTSVFAISPELVHVTTGRHGHGWELVFHADRSFTKTALGTPHHGTCVTLIKRTQASRRGLWQRDISEALQFWCEHCQIPVLLDDHALLGTATPPEAPATVPEDPFAAFATPKVPDPRQMTRPLDLPGAEWVVQTTRHGIDVCAGLGRTPAYRWYNGGLTLLSTSEPSCLGDHAAQLGHLQFKVQHRGLEHTLTRDNVIQDAEWARAITVLHDAARALEAKITAAHAQAHTDQSDLMPTLRALSAIAAHTQRLPAGRPPLWVPQLHGPPIRLNPRGPAPEVAREPTILTEALHAAGIAVVPDLPALRTLFAVAGRPLPDPVPTRWIVAEPNASPDPILAQAVATLLRRARVRSLEVRWCAVHGASAPHTLLRAPSPKPMRRDHLDAHAFTRLMGQRTVWINTAHANVQLAANVARVAPIVAAYAVLQAAFATWDGLRSRRFSAIRAVVRP